MVNIPPCIEEIPSLSFDCDRSGIDLNTRWYHSTLFSLTRERQWEKNNVLHILEAAKNYIRNQEV